MIKFFVALLSLNLAGQASASPGVRIAMSMYDRHKSCAVRLEQTAEIGLGLPTHADITAFLNAKVGAKLIAGSMNRANGSFVILSAPEYGAPGHLEFRMTKILGTASPSATEVEFVHAYLRAWKDHALSALTPEVQNQGVFTRRGTALFEDDAEVVNASIFTVIRLRIGDIPRDQFVNFVRGLLDFENTIRRHLFP